MKPELVTLDEALKRKFRSQLEADFALHLKFRAKEMRIVWWAYESLKFRIGDGTFYLADFVAWTEDRRMLVFEVKGEFSRRAGELAFRAAKELNPHIQFVWTTRREAGGWRFTSNPLPHKKKKKPCPASSVEKISGQHRRTRGLSAPSVADSGLRSGSLPAAGDGRDRKPESSQKTERVTESFTSTES